MTTEELEKEADEYVTTTGNNDCTIEAYIAGAESRERRIAELEKEIKNLKLLHSYDVRVLESKNEKAKEIIKGILPYTTFTFDEETDFYLKKYYKQAEDFIKE